MTHHAGERMFRDILFENGVSRRMGRGGCSPVAHTPPAIGLDTMLLGRQTYFNGRFVVRDMQNWCRFEKNGIRSQRADAAVQGRR